MMALAQKCRERSFVGQFNRAEASVLSSADASCFREAEEILIMRIWTALRVFFRTLFDQQLCAAVQQLLENPVTDDVAAVAPATDEPAARPQPVSAAKPQRNDAITLLSALQREARFVDLVKEPLSNYSDAQVGAAARDILRDCGSVLDRFFDLQPAVEQDEGCSIEIPAGFDAGQYQLKGAVTGEPPYQGSLVHHGWLAGKCELPQWTGKDASRMVVAPIQVEVKSS